MTGRLLAAALLAVGALYGSGRHIDLQCDELAFIRPWSWPELAGVWHGTWDPHLSDAVFFRPLTSWFFAATFELFGVNAAAHIALSMALLAAVAFALALFVARETDSEAVGILAALIFAIHPNTPWSTGLWVMNDFHKLAALAVLSACLVWQRVRHRGPRGWWPIAVIAIAAFLIKEDNLMLIPALLTAQWARARMLRDVNAPSPSLIAGGTAIVCSLWTWRWLALRELGGFALPDAIEKIVRNLLRGPFYALIAQGNESASFGSAAFAAGAITLTLLVLLLRRLPSAQRWPAIFALILMAWYDAPLALISFATRYYIVTIASSIVFAVAASSLWTLASSRSLRAMSIAGAAALLLFIGLRQQAVLAEFSPCGVLPRGCTDWMLETVADLPPEARTFLAGMPASCRAGVARRLDENDTLTWGLRGSAIVDTTTGARTRQAGAHVVTLLRASATSASVRMRHPEASASSPIEVALTIDGRSSGIVKLTSPDWVNTSVPVAAGGWRVWLRGMHRADAIVTVFGAERAGLEWQSFAAHP